MTIEFRQLPPAADLALFVRHYWFLKGENPELAPQSIFPDGAPEIVFNLGDPVLEYDEQGGEHSVQPRALLVGQMTRAVWIIPQRRMHMVGVKLAPWGVAAFCDTGASDVRNATLALSDVCVASRRLVLDSDYARGLSDVALAAHLDRVLRSRLAAGDGRRARRLASFAQALSMSSWPSADGWSRSLGCSVRTLERAFDDYVGIPPKVLMRLRRFQFAMRLGLDSPSLSLSAVAARAGYADQSHLAKEFREFAGVPPSAALSQMTDFSSRFLSGDESD